MKVFSSKLRSVVFTAFITLSIADPLVVQSEKLVGYNNCNTTKQKMIVDAWYSAMEIANNVNGGIDFTSRWAEEEFLGPMSRNQPAQKDLKAVLENAATFQLAYSWNWRAWKTHVRCDDWQQRCSDPKRKVLAYTNNPGSKVIPGTPTPWNDTINFCPIFFDRLPTCNAAIARWGKSPFWDRREDLTNYQCQGYALLHELYHLNSLSKVGSQGHIYDRNIRYRIHDGTLVFRQAYGPTYCKVLASWVNDDVGSYIVTNADNLAQYSLSKWVQKKVGLYPRFPTRDGLTQDPNLPPNLAAAFSTVDNELIVNETALLPYIQGPIVQTLDDLDGTCDDDITDCSYATNSSLTIDMIDPFINSAATGDTASEFNRPDSYQAMNIDPYILPSDPNLDCFKGKGIDWTQQPSLPQPFAATQIANFCNLTQGIPMSNATQDVIDTMYPVPATTFNLWLQAGWQVGDPACSVGRAPDLSECTTQLSIILNGCDTDSTTMKYGGNRVNNCITWTMFIEGVGAAPPDPGQHFSCQLLDVETPTCSCSDGEVYPLDPSGGCNYSSPPFKRARRAA